MSDDDKQIARTDMRRYATHLLQLAHAQGNHTAQRLFELALAALDYGDNAHRYARGCRSHPADCAACAAFKALEDKLGVKS